jgi:hypothetical protein
VTEEPEYDPTEKTVDDVMADVENGVADAQSVLVAEQGAPKPRTTLIERLTRHLEEQDPGDGDGDGDGIDPSDVARTGGADPSPVDPDEPVRIPEGQEVLTTPDPTVQEGYTSSDVGQEQGTPAPEPKGSTGEALSHRDETRTY